MQREDGVGERSFIGYSAGYLACQLPAAVALVQFWLQADFGLKLVHSLSGKLRAAWAAGTRGPAITCSLEVCDSPGSNSGLVVQRLPCTSRDASAGGRVYPVDLDADGPEVGHADVDAAARQLSPESPHNESVPPRGTHHPDGPRLWRALRPSNHHQADSPLTIDKSLFERECTTRLFHPEQGGQNKKRTITRQLDLDPVSTFPRDSFARTSGDASLLELSEPACHETFWNSNGHKSLPVRTGRCDNLSLESTILNEDNLVVPYLKSNISSIRTEAIPVVTSTKLLKTPLEAAVD